MCEQFTYTFQNQILSLGVKMRLIFSRTLHYYIIYDKEWLDIIFKERWLVDLYDPLG